MHGGLTCVIIYDAQYRIVDEQTEPADLSAARGLTDLVPLSKLMTEQIAVLRTWAKGRARTATSTMPESKLRKLAA